MTPPPSTPLADPLPPPQKRPSQLLAGLIGGLIGGVSCLAVFIFAQPLIGPLVKSISALPAGLLAIFAASLGIVAHEFGHVLGGALAGFRFQFMVFAFLRLEQVNGRLRLALNRDLSLAGGVALSLPTDDANLERRYTLFIAAGPLASFLLGIISVLAGVFLVPAPGYLQLFLLTFGLISIMLGVVTLLPVMVGVMPSDGLRLLRMWRGGPLARRDIALVRIFAAGQLAQRPRDWPAPLVAEMLLPADGSAAEFFARSLALLHALDLHDTPAIASHRARILTLHPAAPDPSRAPFLLEILLSFILDHNLPAARNLLPTLTPLRKYLAPHSARQLDAISLHLQGQTQEALTLLSAPGAPPPPADPYIQDRHTELLAALKSPTPTAADTPSS